jgi:hypothetical protein
MHCTLFVQKKPEVTNDLYMERALGEFSKTYQYPKNVRKEVVTPKKNGFFRGFAYTLFNKIL